MNMIPDSLKMVCLPEELAVYSQITSSKDDKVSRLYANYR